MSKEKFKIENKAGKGRVEITSEIGWWGTSGEYFTALCKKLLADGVQDIEVYLNTPGGSVFDANEIINQLKQFKGEKVAILGAICASAGTLISSEMDRVMASKNCQFMIHDVSMYLAINHLKDFDTNRQLYENLTNNALDSYEKKTKLKRDDLQQMMTDTTWMSAKDAKKNGFVDEIIDTVDAAPSDTAAVLTKMGIAIPTTLNLSNNIPPNKSKMKEIAKSLGLPEDATEEQINAAITALKNIAAHANNLLVASAEAKGLKKETVIKVANASFEAAVDLVNDTVVPLVTLTAEVIAAEKPDTTRLSDVLAELKNSHQAPDERKGWKFSDYSKNAPADLKEMAKTNKAKFVALFKAEFGIEPSETDINSL